MTEEITWRPLGVETDDEVASYDALHDGVPQWMSTGFWAWVQTSISRRYSGGTMSSPSYESGPDLLLISPMAEVLQFWVPDLRGVSSYNARERLNSAMQALRTAGKPLQIADYLLAHEGHGDAAQLDQVLTRSKSLYRVGQRSGRPGLERRLVRGVREVADQVMSGSGLAGARLATAWEHLYGLTPSASEAYRYAIKAVEAAAVPTVSPTNTRATLGTVLAQMESQANWALPMGREHPQAPSAGLVVAMLRTLWHCQHDRHDGQPSAPGSVSIDEAKVAVGLAVVLVQWFADELVQRR